MNNIRKISLNMEFIESEADCACGDCRKCGYASQVWDDEISELSNESSYESSFIDDLSETESSDEITDVVCIFLFKQTFLYRFFSYPLNKILVLFVFLGR